MAVNLFSNPYNGVIAFVFMTIVPYPLINPVGPMTYDQAVVYLGKLLNTEKKTRHERQALLVGIEGPSNSGKTILASNLVNQCKIFDLEGLVIEGDSFQRIRTEGMEVYKSILKELE